MDINIPGTSGMDLTRIIKQDISPSTRVIAMTATASQKEVDACLNEGASDVLFKPVSIHGLNDMLQKWFS